MFNIVFKNLDHSPLVSGATKRRLESVFSKFPYLRKGRFLVTVEMTNSPTQAGKDQFCVSLQSVSGPLKGMRLKKSAPLYHQALASLVEGLLERIHRILSRSRKVQRNQARRASHQPFLMEESA
jgi:hypothetical protein